MPTAAARCAGPVLGATTHVARSRTAASSASVKPAAQVDAVGTGDVAGQRRLRGRAGDHHAVTRRDQSRPRASGVLGGRAAGTG